MPWISSRTCQRTSSLFDRRCKLAIEPPEIGLGTVHHWNCDHFRHIVRVDFLDFSAQGGEEVAARLDQQQPFGGVLNFSFPTVDAAGIREDVNAGGEALVDQSMR